MLYHKQNQPAYERGAGFPSFTFVVRQALAICSESPPAHSIGNGCSGQARRGDDFPGEVMVSSHRPLRSFKYISSNT